MSLATDKVNNMVQRYAGADIGPNGLYMFDNGRWVKYEDYELLKQEFMDYVVLKEKQIANLERALGAGETRYV